MQGDVYKAKDHETKAKTNGTGSPLPGSAIPTVGHWGGLGLGVRVRVRVGYG